MFIRDSNSHLHAWNEGRTSQFRGDGWFQVVTAMGTNDRYCNCTCWMDGWMDEYLLSTVLRRVQDILSPPCFFSCMCDFGHSSSAEFYLPLSISILEIVRKYLSSFLMTVDRFLHCCGFIVCSGFPDSEESKILRELLRLLLLR